MTRFRTMRGLDIFLLLFATLVGAGPLVFNDTTGLPSCAYLCPALYTAQYECATAPESEQVECFCGSSSVQWKEDDWAGCDDSCTDETDEERVDAWVEAICGSSSKEDDERTKNWNTTDPHTIISDINPDQIQEDSAKSAAAQAVRVRNWWSRNYPFFVLVFLLITIPIICYAIAIPLKRWCKRQLAGRCPEAQASMEDIGPYTSVFAPTGSRHGEQQYVTTVSNGLIREHTVIIPQVATDYPADYPADSSVRQHSWEERVRHQFESKKPFVERIKFWNK